MPVSFKSSTLGASTGGRSEETHHRSIGAQATPYRHKCAKCGARRIDSQLGLEPTPDQYVSKLVEVFREVRRVLRDDGVVFLNLGDSYFGGARRESADDTNGRPPEDSPRRGLKPKDLVGIPWLVAFALRADGWYLRSDVIWQKPNPMPESVTDRPTRSHEYIFLLSKSKSYYWDQEAVREPHLPETIEHRKRYPLQRYNNKAKFAAGHNKTNDLHPAGRNIRSVWNIATQPFSQAHFATFPTKLVEPCILAGSSPKACGECGAPFERIVERMAVPASVGETKGRYSSDEAILSASSRGIGKSRQFYREQGMEGPPPPKTVGWQPTCTHSDDSGQSLVLDCFCGSGTVGVVALRHNRSFIGLELNPSYCDMARNRIRDDAPLLNHGLEVAA